MYTSFFLARHVNHYKNPSDTASLNKLKFTIHITSWGFSPPANIYPFP